MTSQKRIVGTVIFAIAATLALSTNNSAQAYDGDFPSGYCDVHPERCGETRDNCEPHPRRPRYEDEAERVTGRRECLENVCRGIGGACGGPPKIECDEKYACRHPNPDRERDAERQEK